MPRKPETLIVEKIMDRLSAEGGFWFKVHGGAFQLAGIPDILGCWKGQFVAIEVKTETGKPTKLQLYRIEQILAAGGRAGIARNVEEALRIRDGG